MKTAAQTEHTPGPWIIVGNRIQTEGTDRERKTVATLPVSAFEPDTPDARLIAAAPALLAALEGLLTARKGAMPWDSARAAIRAAKGE